MAYVLNYCLNVSDCKFLEKELVDLIAMVSEDEWKIKSMIKLEEFSEEYKKHSQIDISCFDVTSDGSVDTLEHLRKSDKKSMLVLISDLTVSPLKYMKPSLMAGALILKPMKNPVVSLTLREVLDAVCTPSDNNSEKRFCVETKNGKQFIPFDKIIYFEAREKKIFVNTLYEEFAFYSSLDVLEQTLPESFVRCHRSYIVNKKKITQILFSRNTVFCGEKIAVPLSRSYKPALKEIMENESYVR